MQRSVAVMPDRLLKLAVPLLLLKYLTTSEVHCKTDQLCLHVCVSIGWGDRQPPSNHRKGPAESLLTYVMYTILYYDVQ
ncbi:hypothetical protein GGR55DRAFT_629599 [Xylaria sp. FL0064]|nr:hypothetical protein GGR55DRAFT_629599 [Xylaria sp. FL0064]